MEDIAKTVGDTSKRRYTSLLKIVIVTMSVPTLASCVGNGLDFGSSLPDNALTTATTPAAQKTVSDEITIRNAVTSADLSKLGTAPLPWANSSTGSAGVVEQISEIADEGVVCRDFVTTSHSYEGVSKYQGRTCLRTGGDWTMVTFGKQG